MALPKLNTPTYELEVPSTDQKIKYRPFLVKEEKILLMAMESKDNTQIIQAVKDICFIMHIRKGRCEFITYVRYGVYFFKYKSKVGRRGF